MNSKKGPYCERKISLVYVLGNIQNVMSDLIMIKIEVCVRE